MDVQVVVFLLGVLLLVAAGYLYLKREDNDYTKLIAMVTELKSDQQEIKRSVNAMEIDHDRQCAGLEGQIISLKSQTDRIEKVSKEPMKISITKMVPVSIEYSKKEMGMGKEALLKLPLLKKAGIKKYKEDGITPRENN